MPQHTIRTEPLRSYQKTAVNWALERLYVNGGKGAGLFLDPGLGKTRTSLTIAKALLDIQEVKRVLVIAPLRVVYNVWPAEIMDWGFDLSHIVLHGQHTQAMRENCQIEIINPEGLVKLDGIKNRWDIVFVDESTKFKNFTSERMKFFKRLLPTIPKRVILTGTPAANSLADLFSQLFIVDDGESLGKTLGYFRNLYMVRGGWQGRQWVVREDRQQELLEKIGDRTLRMDAESYLDMPRIVENNIWITLPPECQSQYKKLKRDLAVELASGHIVANSAGSAYQKCKQFANGSVYNKEEDGTRTSHKAHDAKITALADLVEELQGKPLFVGYNFTQDCDRLLQHKAFKNCPFIRGKQKASETERIIAAWNRGEIPVLLCQIQGMSHGLNMQKACNDVAYFGLCDSPETYGQFFRRVYRQGVLGEFVRLHRLLCRGTVDEVMLERILAKGMTEKEFLDALKKHALSR